MTAEEIKTLLNLQPHPIEGGWYRRTYTSAGSLDLPRGTRAVFHFYLGEPVEMLQLYADGRSALITLGPDLTAGQHVQLVVPAGVWQGTRLIGDGKVALLGCTVTPGFDFADYHNASYDELVAKWPGEAKHIRALTRR